MNFGSSVPNSFE